MGSIEYLDWDITDITKFTDGDTFRADLFREYLIIHGVSGKIVVPNMSLRLIIVQPPERRDDPVGWAQARDHLTSWLLTHSEESGLGVTTYGSAGWDRLLADVYPRGDRNNTATKYMLSLGWPIHPDYPTI